MNERIKELAKCNERIENFFVTGPVQRAAIEEFAELVVRECADTVTDRCEMHGEYDEKRAEYYAKRIKEHFGVEE